MSDGQYYSIELDGKTYTVFAPGDVESRLRAIARKPADVGKLVKKKITFKPAATKKPVKKIVVKKPAAKVAIKKVVAKKPISAKVHQFRYAS